MARRKRLDQPVAVKTFAKRLRAERKRKGMSQQALALSANMTISYIGKLERAESAPGLDTVARLAEALGVRLERLITDSAKPPAGLAVAKGQLERNFRRLLNRSDEEALQAVAVVVALVNNALARRKT